MKKAALVFQSGLSLQNSLAKYTQWVYYIEEVMDMDIRELRMQLGDTQSEFAARYEIPFRTIQNWETGLRKPPEYMVSLLQHRIQEDLINRKTMRLPEYDPRKPDLPKRGDYIGASAWLRAVQERIGQPVVFALDEALMCQGNFGGRSDEYLVWVYAEDTVTRFNGVAVLGNSISSIDVQKKNGLAFTSFNRTLSDALANESILDMQGITEAVSRYYYTHADSFEGLFVPPKYQQQFEQLARDAVDYYNN